MNRSTLAEIYAAHPEIAAVLILVLGFFFARLARSLVGHLLAALDRHTARYATRETGIVSPEFIGFTKGLTFWVIFLLALVSALHLLGIDGLSSATSALFALIPKLLIGFAIIGAGHLLGLLLRSLTARLADTIDTDSLGPRLVHGTVLMIAVVLGLQHLGIDITFITQLVLVLLVVVLGGLALAFALGARRHTANLIASTELQRYGTGDRLQIGAYRGTVVSIHRTGLELATEEGVVAIPASRFAEEPVLRLTGEDGDE